MNGNFELKRTDDGVYLHLSLNNGQKFSVCIHDGRLVVHDLSWNDFFMGGKKSLTREAVLAITHSEIPLDNDVLGKMYDFIDLAGIAPKDRETVD